MYVLMLVFFAFFLNSCSGANADGYKNYHLRAPSKDREQQKQLFLQQLDREEESRQKRVDQYIQQHKVDRRTHIENGGVMELYDVVEGVPQYRTTHLIEEI